MPSTVIRSFSYDARRNILQIHFVSGLVYRYKQVPERVYEALKAAGSRGRYFNQQIKDRYDFERVESL